MARLGLRGFPQEKLLLSRHFPRMLRVAHRSWSHLMHSRLRCLLAGVGRAGNNK